MNQDDANTDFQEWADFSVASATPASTASDLYNSYIIYKERLNTLPKKELVRRGWISTKEDSTSLVDYFRDVHEEQGSALYRKSDTANASLISLWLSKVKSQGEMEILLSSIPKFDGLSKEKLREISRLSVDVNVLPELPKILSDLGIVLIYMEALPSMKLDGAVFKVASGHPVIGMSLRYPRLDNFWFTLLHELSHLHLHMDVLDTPILEDFDCESESAIEVSANRLAKNTFVERRIWRNCEPKYDKSFGAIEKFANEMGVHIAIIAGMLRKESGNYTAYSKIVNEHDVREIVFNGS
ncbi:ImmA/IrrE family metallo-endopeptidase [Sessilibacter corallicola]|uniref:IrrE N-terminal-like domain-containing protein n=1 Tax=Sessilibacter corallicola TaxID=2904075 RepID=A0ABQ0A5K2_9GAMM